jgi:uncharacterized protein YfaS (alpha-2-macroglobulin family)
MVSATGAHWETSATSGESAVEATARALAALERISPADPFVPASARWLMLARQGNAWDCPHDSAQALAALSAFAQKVQESQVSYHYSVALNGSGRAAGTETKATRTVSIPASALHSGTRSSLTVAASSVHGIHPLYYVARLRYYLKASAIAARNEGLSVSRRYLDLHGNRMSSAAAGSVVRVQLTIDTGQTLSYLDVEDPIPAGFEPIDASLKTSRQGLFPAWQLAATGRDDLTPYLDHTDLHDNRVSLYAHTLPPGTYHFSYLAQATVAGSYEVAPTHASESFFPEVFGRSAGESFVVR